MKTQIFLNLPVRDLNRSVAFFTQLGFSFNPKYTDEKATCLIIGENINAMLLVEEFYSTFTNKQICNTTTTTTTTSEVLIAISVETREQVDEIITKAMKAGGTEYMETKDYGWMYQRTFLDVDGHHWEMFFADESQIPN